LLLGSILFDSSYAIDGNVHEFKKLLGSDVIAGDKFGTSVSISGDTIVVGEKHPTGPLRVTSVYIFFKDQGGLDNWGEVKKLDGASGSNFGASVSILGDTLVVGATLEDSVTGAAYIFQRDQGGANNWGEVKRLVASDRTSGDQFGFSVSNSGDTVIIGANGHDDNGGASGSAYIFSKDQDGINNWGEVKKITASDGDGGDSFGDSVAISGDTVVVGARGDETPTVNTAFSGSAYIFSKDQDGINNWGEVKKLQPPDLSFPGSELFGSSVSILGDTIAVGASQSSITFNLAGATYIFDRDQGGANNWGQVKRIHPDDNAQFFRFGSSVFISADRLVVGANGFTPGAIYSFIKDLGGLNNWGQEAKGTTLIPAPFAGFGSSVANEAGIAVAAFPQDSDIVAGGGSTFLFDLNDTDGDGVVDQQDNCPEDVNTDQTDGDSDGLGDVCDAFPQDPDNDVDSDGVGADTDNCPVDSNADQSDIDGDLVGDVCDNAPNDFNPAQDPVSCGSGTSLAGNECDPDVTQAQLDQALAAVPNALAQRDAILAQLFEFLRVFGVI